MSSTGRWLIAALATLLLLFAAERAEAQCMGGRQQSNRSQGQGQNSTVQAGQMQNARLQQFLAQQALLQQQILLRQQAAAQQQNAVTASTSMPTQQTTGIATTSK
jgi:hypothetical protein